MMDVSISSSDSLPKFHSFFFAFFSFLDGLDCLDDDCLDKEEGSTYIIVGGVTYA